MVGACVSALRRRAGINQSACLPVRAGPGPGFERGCRYDHRRLLQRHKDKARSCSRSCQYGHRPKRHAADTPPSPAAVSAVVVPSPSGQTLANASNNTRPNQGPWPLRRKAAPRRTPNRSKTTPRSQCLPLKAREGQEGEARFFKEPACLPSAAAPCRCPARAPPAPQASIQRMASGTSARDTIDKRVDNLARAPFAGRCHVRKGLD